MIVVQQDFQDRVNEIEAYFNFVIDLDEGNTLLVKKESSHSFAYTRQEQGDIVRTFKATAFLLLYNLMESTVSNAVEAIFDELSNHNVSFDACRKEIQSVVLDNLKQHNTAEILPTLNRLSTDVITKTFRKNKIVSGNVDAKEIKAVANKYGFDRPSADGSHLLTVKSSRNNLAHGSKSFAEVGRDYTVSELKEMKDKVIVYLNAMLTNIAVYITNQHYLSASGRI